MGEYLFAITGSERHEENNSYNTCMFIADIKYYCLFIRRY